MGNITGSMCTIFRKLKKYIENSIVFDVLKRWRNWKERDRKIYRRKLNWDGNKYMGKKGWRKNWQLRDRRGEGERTKRVNVIGEQISSTDLVTTNMVIITRVRKCNNEPVLSFPSREVLAIFGQLCCVLPGLKSAIVDADNNNKKLIILIYHIIRSLINFWRQQSRDIQL